jgi:hypothetical protein
MWPDAAVSEFRRLFLLYVVSSKWQKLLKFLQPKKNSPILIFLFFIIFFSFSILVVALLGGIDDILNMLQTLMKIQIFFCGVTPAETLLFLTFSCVFKSLFVLTMYSVFFCISFNFFFLSFSRCLSISLIPLQLF